MYLVLVEWISKGGTPYVYLVNGQTILVVHSSCVVGDSNKTRAQIEVVVAIVSLFQFSTGSY